MVASFTISVATSLTIVSQTLNGTMRIKYSVPGVRGGQEIATFRMGADMDGTVKFGFHTRIVTEMPQLQIASEQRNFEIIDATTKRYTIYTNTTTTGLFNTATCKYYALPSLPSPIDLRKCIADAMASIKPVSFEDGMQQFELKIPFHANEHTFTFSVDKDYIMQKLIFATNMGSLRPSTRRMEVHAEIADVNAKRGAPDAAFFVVPTELKACTKVAMPGISSDMTSEIKAVWQCMGLTSSTNDTSITETSDTDTLSIAIAVSFSVIACLALWITMLLALRRRARSLFFRWGFRASAIECASDSGNQITTPEQSSKIVPEDAAVSELSSTWGVPEIFHRGVDEHWFYGEHEVKIETDVVACGSFGAVRKGKLLGSTVVAFKSCLDGTGSDKELVALVNEIRLLRRVRHPHVVLFFGVSYLSNAKSIGILLEWIDGMDLRSYAQQLKPVSIGATELADAGPASSLSWLHIAKLVQDVRSGMQFLHLQTPPIVHRDLKPSNILVEMIAIPPRAKISDFGLSVLQTEVASKGRAGTKGFIAPEVLSGGACTLSSDVYSFGCTITRVVARLNSDASAALKILRAPDVTIAAIESCSMMDPESRPSFVQLEQPFEAWLPTKTTTPRHSGLITL